MEKLKTLQQAIIHFASERNCLQFMVAMRWPHGVECPTCGRTDARFLKNQHKWQCKSVHHHRQFSVKVGTIFEDSPIPLTKWLPAAWQLVNCKNGVSSYEIGRALGVTQKTAWFMLQRIRLALQNGSLVKLGGNGQEVEVDETFIGGKSRNMHKGRRLQAIHGTGGKGKVAVMGLLQRGGEVRANVVPYVRRHVLQGEVRKHVEAGTPVYSDALLSYHGLARDYQHQVIDHAVAYVDGKIHTNGLENFWSLLKRGLKGTYVCVEPFHLFRYVDEQAWRYNNRKLANDGERFVAAMSGVAGKRLTYAHLTGKTQVLETSPD
jgi:transposase-like protein